MLTSGYSPYNEAKAKATHSTQQGARPIANVGGRQVMARDAMTPPPSAPFTPPPTSMVGGKPYEFKGIPQSPLQQAQAQYYRGKAGTGTRPTRMAIKKLAQTQASRLSGGSTFMGMSEDHRDRYKSLEANIEQKYLAEFGYNDTELEDQEIDDTSNQEF